MAPVPPSFWHASTLSAKDVATTLNQANEWRASSTAVGARVGVGETAVLERSSSGAIGGAFHGIGLVGLPINRHSRLRTLTSGISRHDIYSRSGELDLRVAL